MGKDKGPKTIQVFFRVRPANATEKERGDVVDYIGKDAQNDTILTLGDPAVQRNRAKFHGLFMEDSKQDEVFKAVGKKAVEDAFDGYFGLLFVYGQTGTGKTYTMSCKEPGNEGIFQRSIGLVFDKIQEDTAGDYDVSCTFIQIYQEVIQDLLAGKFKEKETKGLQLRQDPDYPTLVHPVGVKEEILYTSGTSVADGKERAEAAFKRGDDNRTVASTAMNDTSSRSHTVFSIKIKRRKRMTEAAYESSEGQKEFTGHLVLVDLAGCERQKKTGASGARLSEASAINSSLMNLGIVINALAEAKPGVVIPFRTTKLTRLLQFALEGKGRTSLIVTAGPSTVNQEETRNAVQFGLRAMTVKAEAKSFVTFDYKGEYLKLKAQLEQGADEAQAVALQEMQQRYESLLEEKDERIRELEVELGAAGPSILSGSFRAQSGSMRADPVKGVPASPVAGMPVPQQQESAAAEGGAAEGNLAEAEAELAARYTNAIDQLKEELQTRKEKLREKREEIEELRREKAEADKQVLAKEREVKVVSSRLNEFGEKIRVKLENVTMEKQRLLECVLKMRRDQGLPLDEPLDDVSDDASVGRDSPAPTSDEPEIATERNVAILWEDRLKQLDKLAQQREKVAELQSERDHFKAAVRHLHSQLEKEKDRSDKYRRALLEIKVETEKSHRHEDYASDHSSGRKEKKEKKHRRDQSVSDADFSGLDTSRKEKKEKKKKKKEDTSD